MKRPLTADLIAFITVAREKSFTRAAAQLGVSQSALSHTVRGLEARLELRLLTRTTRSVAPTAAGEHLLQTVAPLLEEIDAELERLRDGHARTAGTVRITTGEHVADSVLIPRLSALQRECPDIRVELVVDYGLTDIVAARFDAGVRVGDQVERDMIAVRIGPDLRMAVVGAPGYFATRPRPRHPQDLALHSCIALRSPSHGGVYPWEFEKRGRTLKVNIDGGWIVNTLALRVSAALQGCGLAYVPEAHVAAYLSDGRLERVLEDWCPPFPGYHLYYPSRKFQSPAFVRVVEALRWREENPRAKGAKAAARKR